LILKKIAQQAFLVKAEDVMADERNINYLDCRAEK
jgi:hypothetical protein